MRSTLIESTVVGVTLLLSGCSTSSSATHASLAAIPVSEAPTGSSIKEESFTGTGSKTEPAVTLRGNKVWVYIACVSRQKGDPLPDAQHGGVQVSAGGSDLGGAGCGTDDGKSSPLIIINVPLKGTMTGPLKIETAKDTRWRVTLGSGS